MSSNWIFPLEMCASGGVIDYDAAADILDMPQRFVGHPQIGEIPAINRPLYFPPGTKINGELNENCYNTPSNLIKNPSWKKWLFGGIAAVAALALILGKGKIKKANLTEYGTSIKEFGKKVWSYIKKPFEYIASKLKK